jgi:hypothetical protein
LDILVGTNFESGKRQLQQYIESMHRYKVMGPFCGYVFEHYTLELLEKGGQFTCRRLTHGNKKLKPKETCITIIPSKRIAVDRIELNQTKNTLYVPNTRNLTAIDAWIPGLGAFQVTISATHIIKGIDNYYLKSVLGKNASKLYWLLPPLYYDSFSKKCPQEIDQYAVKIPYPKGMSD